MLPLDAALDGVYLNQGPERVVLGQPAGATARAEAERLGAQRVFLISGASLAHLAQQRVGPLFDVQQALGERCAGAWTAMRAHSPREDVIAAAQAAREARADLLLAVGGGSAIDGCKAVAMCLWLGVETPDAMEPYRFMKPGALPIVAPPGAIRMLSVSTMLAAADFTPSAGVTASELRAKQSYRHPLLVPRTAILDPAATLHAPLPLLLASGMRAVDHAVESYCATHAHAAGQMHASTGLQLLAQALPAMQREPQALLPRRQAQLGMWQAIQGSATGAGTGASHGIGYALGATFDINHGHTSCVLLPAVLRFNASVNGDRQRALAAAIGRPESDLADAVSALIDELGLPARLRDVGVTREHWHDIAKRALAYEPVQRNPRPIRDAADVMQILELADA